MALPSREKTQAPAPQIWYAKVSRYQVEIAAKFIAATLEQDEKKARSIFRMGVNNPSSASFVVWFAETLAECIAVESGDYEKLKKLTKELGSQGEKIEYLAFLEEEKSARRLSPSQCRIVVDQFDEIFGQKPVHPGPRPATNAKNFVEWLTAFDQWKRSNTDFGKAWSRGFNDLLIGEGCRYVLSSIAFLSVFNTSEEMKTLNKALDEAYAQDKGKRETATPTAQVA